MDDKKGPFDFIDMNKINSDVDLYADVDSYVDTGSYMFNALLSGSIYDGLPGNKVTALAGEPATGKTYFLLGIVRKFLENDENAGVIFFESESAISSSMMKDRGIDIGRIHLLPVATVEDFKTQAINIMKALEEVPENKRNPILFCLDSLGQLSTKKETEDAESGSDKRDFTRAPIIKGAFRVLTQRLGRLGLPMVITNHTYDSIGSFYTTKVMAGGSGLKYSADSIVYLSKKKEKEGTDVVGNIIHCRNFKSRLTVENKQVDVLLRYDTGLNRYYGLIDLALDCGVFKKNGKHIVLPDGSKTFGATINKNPEKYFTKEVLDQLDIAAKKEFLYGLLNQGD